MDLLIKWIDLAPPDPVFPDCPDWDPLGGGGGDLLILFYFLIFF